MKIWKRHGYDFTGFTDPLLALENFKFKYNTYRHQYDGG
jgi:hypothetical protein